MEDVVSLIVSRRESTNKEILHRVIKLLVKRVNHSSIDMYRRTVIYSIADNKNLFKECKDWMIDNARKSRKKPLILSSLKLLIYL